MIAPDAIDLDKASRIEQGFHTGNIIKCLPLVEPTLDIGECGYEIVRFNHMQSGQFTGCTKTARQVLIKELAAIDSPDVEASPIPNRGSAVAPASMGLCV